MAGENPEDPRIGPARRVPVEDQVAALPDPDHGPGDEPGAGRGRARRGADAGRNGPCLHQPAGAGRRGEVRDRRRRRPGFSAATSSPGSVPLTFHTWEHLEMAVASRPEREVEMVVIRDGQEQRLTIRPDLAELRTRGNARFEIGTIGVWPDVNPSIRALVAGEPAEKAGLKPGDVILSIDGERMVFASQVSEAISKNPEQDNSDDRAAQRRRADDRRHALAAGRERAHRHQHQRRSGVVHAVAAAGRRHERAAQLRDVRDDPRARCATCSSARRRRVS